MNGTDGPLKVEDFYLTLQSYIFIRETQVIPYPMSYVLFVGLYLSVSLSQCLSVNETCEL